VFLASIASCFTLALSYASRKRSIELTDLSVTVTGRYDGLRFSSVHVRASVGAPVEDLDRLMLAAERVCYVTNSLRAGVTVTTEAVAS
jgi:organic hydroperoxide reductase OsmC/OhrA